VVIHVIDAASNKLIGVIWGQEWAQENKDIDEMLDDDDGGSMLLGMGEGQGGTACTTVVLISLMDETGLPLLSGPVSGDKSIPVGGPLHGGYSTGIAIIASFVKINVVAVVSFSAFFYRPQLFCV